MNPKIFKLNLAFAVLFLISCALFYGSLYGRLGNGFLVVDLVFQLCRFASEIIILALARMFGKHVQLKSLAMRNGDLLISGIDENGHECFQFTIKSEQEEIDDLDSELLSRVSFEKSFVSRTSFILQKPDDLIQRQSIILQ